MPEAIEVIQLSAAIDTPAKCISTPMSSASSVNRPMPRVMGQVQVWRVALQEHPSPLELKQLSTSEHATARRFIYASHRRCYLAARVALRAILASETGLIPSEVDIAYGPFGKPRIDRKFGVSFNVSHSGDVALVALSHNGEVGVDLEIPRQIHDALELAQLHFSPSECSQLACIRPEDRNDAFLLGWTRKEACLKATGFGLRLATSALETGLCTEDRIVSLAAPRVKHLVRVQSFVEPDGAIYSLGRVLDSSSGMV